MGPICCRNICDLCACFWRVEKVWQLLFSWTDPCQSWTFTVIRIIYIEIEKYRWMPNGDCGYEASPPDTISVMLNWNPYKWYVTRGRCERICRSPPSPLPRRHPLSLLILGQTEVDPVPDTSGRVSVGLGAGSVAGNGRVGRLSWWPWTESAGNDYSIAIDFRGKGFYSSYALQRRLASL